MNGRLTDAEFLEALDDLFVESILAMTPEELREEILAEGGDPDAMAEEARQAGLRAIREAEGRTPMAWSLEPISPRVEIDEAPAAGSLPAVGSFW